MTLESWLERATFWLAPASAEKVREEIREHYESAFEAERERGVSRYNAERAAVKTLGSPAVANRQYRKVLLTANEAKMLELWKTTDPRLGRIYALLASAFLVGALGTVLVLAAIARESFGALPAPEKLSFLASLLSALCVGTSLFAFHGWRRSNPGSKGTLVVCVLHALPLGACRRRNHIRLLRIQLRHTILVWRRACLSYEYDRIRLAN